MSRHANSSFLFFLTIKLFHILLSPLPYMYENNRLPYTCIHDLNCISLYSWIYRYLYILISYLIIHLFVQFFLAFLKCRVMTIHLHSIKKYVFYPLIRARVCRVWIPKQNGQAINFNCLFVDREVCNMSTNMIFIIIFFKFLPLLACFCFFSAPSSRTN